jgi:ATP-binding cassette subfamily B protein
MSVFLALVQFLKPYQLRVWIFLGALVFTAAVTLSIGQGLRLLIDQGFAEQSQSQLNMAI